MRKNNVRALLRVMTPEEVLDAYMSGKTYLTQKQLQYVINKKERVGRGRATIGMKKEDRKNDKRGKKNE